MSREPQLQRDIDVHIYKWYDPVKKAHVFQADIFGPGFDHHGRGASPSEALVLASMHWRAEDVKNKGGG